MEACSELRQYAPVALSKARADCCAETIEPKHVVIPETARILEDSLCAPGSHDCVQGCRFCQDFAAVAALLCGKRRCCTRPTARKGGEANLKLPDLSSVSFLGDIDGHKLLLIGILFCVFGLVFGMAIYHALEEPAGASLHARNF